MDDRFHHWFQGVSEPLLLLDGEGAVLAINLAATDALGADPQALIGKSFASQCETRWANDFLAHSAHAGERGEFCFVREGHVVRFECEGCPLGERAELSVRFWEEDDDESLLQQVVELRHQLGLRRDAQRELETAGRVKDEFFAMLGHELRNPLAPMLTALELMDLKDGFLFQHERSVLKRQTRHLKGMVDDLLDVAGTSHDRIHLDREPLELSDMVREAVETVGLMIDRRHHRLTVDAPKGFRVWADADRLTQVFVSLLANAAHFTEPAGTVRVELRREGNHQVVSVKDSGAGISPELLPHVFDAFARGSHARANGRNGLGLGLTVARGMVELHDGSLEARSEGLGKGTELIVRLPALDDETDLPPATPPPMTSLQRLDRKSNRTRVLIVDDNADAAEMLKESLEGEGFIVRAVYDGPDALRAVRDFVPNVAVLDLGLPVMNGYELAGQLRSQPGLSDLHLIALTGYGQPRDRAEATKVGFSAHLVKPISLPTLIKALEVEAP